MRAMASLRSAARPLIAIALAASTLGVAVPVRAAPPPDLGLGVPRASGPPTLWEAMDFPARKRWMESVVLPRMREVFTGHDPVRFTAVACTTCHGADAEARRFAMPNPALRPLYPSGHPKQRELAREKPDILRFMFGTVIPEVQGLLGLRPYDAATGRGFSCFSCHPRAEAEP